VLSAARFLRRLRRQRKTIIPITANTATTLAAPIPAFAPVESPSSSAGRADGVEDEVIVVTGLDVSATEEGVVDLVGAGTKEAGGSDVAILKS
jgi:hypothetical protein